jgi:hypothetical protein
MHLIIAGCAPFFAAFVGYYIIINDNRPALIEQGQVKARTDRVSAMRDELNAQLASKPK